jgi:hypothetical protein
LPPQPLLSSVLFVKSLSDIFNDNFAGRFKKNANKKTFAQRPDGIDFLALIKEWPNIVGEKNALISIPLRNSNKILYILTQHPAHSQQLSFLEEIIKEKVIEKFPSLKKTVKSLKFVTNSAFFKEKEKAYKIKETSNKKNTNKKLFHNYSPQVIKLKKQANEAFGNIEDQEVKERLISIFIQSGLSGDDE